jgi:asparagine synthase (glutamine-hydrolysing)
VCGIAGYIDRTPRAATYDFAITARQMGRALRHRGPDDEGVWSDTSAGIALALSRLSVIDLSPAGHQPMQSASGRHVIVYNGEVYNHVALRRDLEARGHTFRGHSDTEVILELCDAIGVESTLKRLIGMFAFALWDRGERTLTLARDRLGIKPLYWGRFGELLLFGSELKALLAHHGWAPEIDRNAVAAFLRLAYIPSPHSIYQGINKLEPGCILTVRDSGAPEITRYWVAREVVECAVRDRSVLSDEEATEQLETILRDAIQRRMIADVPVGALLSGGVDSSTVVAVMQAQSARPVKTFTVGFSAVIAGASAISPTISST